MEFLGISADSKILPITLELETDIEVCMAICYAAQQNARVINLSIGVYDLGEGPGTLGLEFPFN